MIFQPLYGSDVNYEHELFENLVSLLNGVCSASLQVLVADWLFFGVLDNLS